MSDDITSGEGTSAAANEMLSAVQAMQSLMANMVGQSKQIADNFKAASKAANATGGGISAHAGDAGKTGAGQRTDMADSLGEISETAQIQQAGFGGHFAAASGMSAFRGGGFGQAMKGGAGSAAGYAAGTVARGAGNLAIQGAETAYNVGRVGVGDAAEMEFLRYRADRMGRNYDTLLGQFTAPMGPDRESALMGLDRYREGGYLAFSGSQREAMNNFNTQVALGAMSGMDPNSAAAAAAGLYKGSSTYGLAAMGVSTRTADGGVVGTHDIANQLYERFNGANLSPEDIERVFNPEMGYMSYNLRSAGMGEEQIEMMKNAFIARSDQGGGRLSERGPGEVRGGEPSCWVPG